MRTRKGVVRFPEMPISPTGQEESFTDISPNDKESHTIRSPSILLRIRLCPYHISVSVPTLKLYVADDQQYPAQLVQQG